MIVAGTGHRLQGVYHGRTKRELRWYARESIVAWQPDLVISGMALGWDQAVALAAIDLGLPFMAILPFEGMESRWEPDTRAEFKWIRERAASELVMRPAYCPESYDERNEAMVDRADVMLALWDGRKGGGTFNCLRYAVGQRKRIVQLWQGWQDRSAPIARRG